MGSGECLSSLGGGSPAPDYTPSSSQPWAPVDFYRLKDLGLLNLGSEKMKMKMSDE